MIPLFLLVVIFNDNEKIYLTKVLKMSTVNKPEAAEKENKVYSSVFSYD